MATINLNLSGDSYSFQGWGVADAIYEKGRPLNNYAGNLGASALTDYCNDLSLFTWIRTHVVGGQFYREGASGLNYPAKKQAATLKKLFATAPFRVIVCPFSAPSATMAEDDQTTLRPSGTELIVSDDVTTRQVFDHATAGNWQTWLDAIDHGIKVLKNMGAGVEILETPNEYGHTGGYVNYWLVYLDNTRAVDWVNKVWLGAGLSGGGIAARHPELSLLSGYTVSGNGQSSIDADGTAGPSVSFWGHGNYGDGITSPSTLGIGGGERFGFGILSEFGPNFGSMDAPAVRRMLNTMHHAIAYCRVHCACMWTSLRDITAKAVADSRGVGYSARPLMDMTTASGTYTYTPLWWAIKPHLTAAGRGTVTAYCAAALTALDGDTNFTPASGVYFSAYKRPDDTYGLVYVNFSGSETNDEIAITTDGATPADLTGTQRTYLPVAGSGQEGTEGAASITAGVVDLGAVANSSVVLLELEAA